MGNKERGANAERELLHLFCQKRYAAVRVAGSGMLPETSCDLLVGKGTKKYAIECKVSTGMKKYLDKAQIKNFIKFAKLFGLEPYIAIKFARKGWFFVRPEMLKKKGKSFIASYNEIEKNGISFFDFVNEKMV